MATIGERERKAAGVPFNLTHTTLCRDADHQATQANGRRKERTRERREREKERKKRGWCFCFCWVEGGRNSEIRMEAIGQ